MLLLYNYAFEGGFLLLYQRGRNLDGDLTIYAIILATIVFFFSQLQKRNKQKNNSVKIADIEEDIGRELSPIEYFIEVNDNGEVFAFLDYALEYIYKLRTKIDKQPINNTLIQLLAFRHHDLNEHSIFDDLFSEIETLNNTHQEVISTKIEYKKSLIHDEKKLIEIKKWIDTYEVKINEILIKLNSWLSGNNEVMKFEPIGNPIDSFIKDKGELEVKKFLDILDLSLNQCKKFLLDARIEKGLKLLMNLLYDDILDDEYVFVKSKELLRLTYIKYRRIEDNFSKGFLTMPVYTSQLNSLSSEFLDLLILVELEEKEVKEQIQK